MALDDVGSSGLSAIPAGELPAVLLRAVAAAVHGITIASASADRPLVYANEAFLRLTGYSAGEVLGRNCRFLQGPDTAAEAVTAIGEALTGGRDITVVLRNYRRDGTPFWNEVSVSAVRDPAGRIGHFIGTQIDVTDRVDNARELQRVAYTDPVTGLSNRAHLTARFDDMRQDTTPAPGAVVVFMDLDGFHRVNEDYDYETGNLVLAGVAQRLSGLTAPGDVLARLGADNFVLLRPAPAPKCRQVGRQLVDTIDQVLTAPIKTAGVSMRVRADCAIACIRTTVNPPPL